jgi:glycerol uptake facilitator protein
VIVMGWAMAVFIAVYVTASFSGAHLNPVVTVSLALAGKFAWAKVPGYVAAQMLGGMAGALLVWVAYRQHFTKESDADVKLGVFCTSPVIRSVPHNLLTEMIATFVLILGVLYLASPQVGLGALDALPVGLLVLGIGISLGGPTGYAMSPARDLSPRLCMRCCRSRASATATGVMRGFRSAVRCSAARWRRACICTCTRTDPASGGAEIESTYHDAFNLRA